MALTHRERVLMTLNHEEPDRVPIDLGGMIATLIHADVCRDMMRRLGWEEGEATPGQAALSEMVSPDRKLLDRVDACVESVGVHIPQQSVTGDGFISEWVDEWGVTWARADAESEFAARRGPFQGDEPTQADLERYPWPDPDDPRRYEGLKDRAARIRAETDHALVLDFPYGILRECQRIRGFTEFLEDMLVNPAIAEGLMEKVFVSVAAVAERALDELGDTVDVVVWLEDLGFQDRGYMRPQLYQRLLKPYHRRLMETLKKKTAAKIMLHSDGSIREVIPDFIDIGVDVINPVQTSAAGMDAHELKREFGRDVSFWGAIDTQRVLPFATPAEVRAEVRARIRDLAPGGGYVLASCHNIQREVPVDNVFAMFEAAAEYGAYPIV